MLSKISVAIAMTGVKTLVGLVSLTLILHMMSSIRLGEMSELEMFFNCMRMKKCLLI